MKSLRRSACLSAAEGTRQRHKLVTPSGTDPEEVPCGKSLSCSYLPRGFPLYLPMQLKKQLHVKELLKLYNCKVKIFKRVPVSRLVIEGTCD